MTAACNSEWTTYVSALLVPTVAVFGLYIAWRQWTTARNRLKLDLFDRRYAVYEAVLKLLAVVFRTATVPEADLRDFDMGTMGAQWLLSADLCNYLRDELRKKAVKLQTIEATLPSVPVEDPKRRILVAEKHEALTWFHDQLEVVNRKFAPFLQLKH